MRPDRSRKPSLSPTTKPRRSPARPPPLFVTGVAGTYNVTTTGFPAATITESGALPAGLSFAANGNGTATIAGTASTAGTYPVSLSATNASGSTSTLALTITVGPPVYPGDHQPSPAPPSPSDRRAPLP